ncbi:MAG: SGNH/GDSL hydrolase family protein [Bacteroidota bacterium]
MWTQTLYFLGGLLSLPLLPILAWQGKRVRKNIPDVPEAEAPFEGSVGEAKANLRLLTLGESTIAGVGVDKHQNGITGQLAEELHRLSGRGVCWKVLAKSGYTAQVVCEQLVPQIPATPFDIIVVGLGGNDTFKLNSPGKWRKDFIHLIQAIQKRQPQSKVVIANMPPVGNFPAFPKLMQLVLGGLVRLHGRSIRDLPHLFERVYYIDQHIHFEEWLDKVEGTYSIEEFFSDGVHPAPITYSLWGKEIAQYIHDQQLL